VQHGIAVQFEGWGYRRHVSANECSNVVAITCSYGLADTAAIISTNKCTNIRAVIPTNAHSNTPTNACTNACSNTCTNTQSNKQPNKQPNKRANSRPLCSSDCGPTNHHNHSGSRAAARRAR